VLARIFAEPVKYPANPPSIGHPETIRRRGELFLVMVVASVVLLVLADRLLAPGPARAGLRQVRETAGV
jgi:Probable cobalt transporter subunit (CbtA)